MVGWMSRASGSHLLQLAVTAVVSGAATIGIFLGYQRIRRQKVVEDLKSSIPDVSQEHIATQVRTFETELAIPSLSLHQQLTEWGAASDILKPSNEDERSTALALRARQGDYDDGQDTKTHFFALETNGSAELILEQLARNRVFLKDEGLAKLRSSFIIIVGCGGVGSHAVAALARSGVSHLRLIDFDQVTLSSLNRHAVATLADVGTPKVNCLRKRLEQVTPWTEFDCRNELFSEKAAEWLLAPQDGRSPDYVVDAIDNIDSKVALLHYCRSNGIRVVSSMGAGCKSDPTRIFVGDISVSAEDPLSRSTRRRLRILGIKDGIPVVYSNEKAGPGKAQLLPLPEEEFQKGGVGELGVLPDFRVRILPVLGTMPAMFGLTVANHVMLEVSGYPHEYLPSKGREKMYESIFNNVQAMEERLAKSSGQDPVGIRVPLTLDDVGYLTEEVFRGRSVITGLSSRLTLTRWRAPDENFIDNSVAGQKCSRLRLRELVCMTKDEAARHEKEVLKGDKTSEEMYEPSVVALVQSRLDEETQYDRYR